MSYSMITIREALKVLGVSKGINPFVWEEKEKPNAPYAVHPQLASQFHLTFKDRDQAGNTFTRQVRTGGIQNFLNDLTEYCWLVYLKALQASGPQLIGRQHDLWVSEYLEKSGIDPATKRKLWDHHTQGNVQVMDKWAPTVNDSWVLGGVHRRADFKLVSDRTLDNLWDCRAGRHVVTARELLGLLHFGYKLKPDKNILICQNAVAARDATLADYDSYMTNMQAQGEASIRSLLSAHSVA